MPVLPLFPDAVNEVTSWFEAQGASVATRIVEREVGDHCRVWRLATAVARLADSHITVVLKADFPVSVARLEVSRDLCLRYPHVEADGHLCHGVQPEPEDFEAPVEALGRVLDCLAEFLTLSQNLGWLEAEFHRERQDYWTRHVALDRGRGKPRGCELLLDVDVNAGPVQDVAAIHLGQGAKALATSSTSEPEKVALARGWTVGTLVRGGCLVVVLPDVERWTPTTWPRSFNDLDAFLSSITGIEGQLSSWYRSKHWPNKAPVTVALLHGTAVFGWQVLAEAVPRLSMPKLVPIEVSRIDRQWSLSRDHLSGDLRALSAKRVAVLGCGSIGSQVVELLARAGVGRIDVVDPQILEAENVSRHLLGLASLGVGKAAAACARVERNVPGVKLTPFGISAAHWLARLRPEDSFHLVVDCTGERSVRIALSKLRNTLLMAAPVAMAWMEPECAAAHVVVVTGQDGWPSSDPAEMAVNVALWPDGVKVDLPGCGEGFHPYGMADSARAAGLAAERVLAVLKGKCTTSGVWSMVRSREYFETVSDRLHFNLEPPAGELLESVTLVRNLPTE